MKIKVKFIGDDQAFYTKLEQRYNLLYNSHTFEFSYCSLKTETNPYEIYRSLCFEDFQIFYLDFEDKEEFASKLSNFINSNAELRKKSFCALHSFTSSKESIQNALLSQVRINHIKGVDLHNIVFDTISFIDVDLAKTPPFSDGNKLGETKITHDLRVSYLAGGKYHVECNTKLPVNKVVELSTHPLDYLNQSNRFLVSNEQSSKLYYNTRFSYDLDFSYVDNMFFRSTEDDWINYIQFKNRKKDYEQEVGDNYDEMVHNVKVRKSKIRYLRDEVKQWISEHSNEEVKKVQVLIFDDELQSLDEFKELDEFNVKFETGLVYDYYQIRRFHPHVIIFNITEKHTEENSQELLDYLSNSEHKPFLIITNTSQQKADINYSNGLCFPDRLGVDTLKNLVSKFKSKVDISTRSDRVFFTRKHRNNAVKVRMKFDIIAFNETLIYFISENEIPMWTVFESEAPVKMLLTVIPDISNSKYSSEKNCYRALINGLNEIEMAKLRVIINQSLEEDSEEN